MLRVFFYNVDLKRQCKVFCNVAGCCNMIKTIWLFGYKKEPARYAGSSINAVKMGLGLFELKHGDFRQKAHTPRIADEAKPGIDV